jgi:NADPH:quinone reductase-like Zn-dependent oxidoreductase
VWQAEHVAGGGSKIMMKLLKIGVGIPIGIATKKLTDRLFAVARPQAEYREVEDAGVNWKDALVWAALSGVGVAAAEIATRKGAEETYRVITGSEPPPQPLSKGQKKALKKQEKAEAQSAK